MGSHDANSLANGVVVADSSSVGALSHIGTVDSVVLGAIALDSYGSNGEGHHDGHKSNIGVEGISAYPLVAKIVSIDIDGLESSSAKTSGTLVGLASIDGVGYIPIVSVILGEVNAIGRNSGISIAMLLLHHNG